jgi:hypothetical protein
MNNKKSKEYIKNVSNIIGINKCYTHGSFLKYGKDKACDIDCYEKNTNLEEFNKYIKRLYNDYKKKKLILISSNFNMKHPLFYELYNKLGYLDGLLNINNCKLNEVLELINKIEDKKCYGAILDLYNNFKETKSLDNFILLKMYVIDKVYPKWTFNDLLKGYLEYYSIVFKIEDLKFETFYIEILYLEEPFNKIRISNFIQFKEFENKRSIYIEKELDNIVINNKIFYYYLVKIIMFFFKKFYYSNIIRDKVLKNNMINIYNDIYNLREKNGHINNKYCNIKNVLDLANIKIKKYNLKIKKHGSNTTYINNLKKYTKIYMDNITIYEDGINEINKLYKDHYYKWIDKYQSYIKRHIRFL